MVLIETYWNVNCFSLLIRPFWGCVLIETYWNVKLIFLINAPL